MNCYPEKCDAELSEKLEETGKRYIINRCCGQRMGKIRILTISTCKKCKTQTQWTWGYYAACKICNKHICTETPYG